MPAKAGKGSKQLIAKYAEKVGEITGPRTSAGIAKVMAVGMSYAKEYAPIEYGTLINSAFRRIDNVGGEPVGTCGFMANYAIYLNGTANYTPIWKPRAPEDKEGPAWNPFATPRFLDLGFTGPLAAPEIQRVIMESYKK